MYKGGISRQPTDRRPTTRRVREAYFLRFLLLPMLSSSSTFWYSATAPAFCSSLNWLGGMTDAAGPQPAPCVNKPKTGIKTNRRLMRSFTSQVGLPIRQVSELVYYKLCLSEAVAKRGDRYRCGMRRIVEQFCCSQDSESFQVRALSVSHHENYSRVSLGLPSSMTQTRIHTVASTVKGANRTEPSP